MKDEELMWEVDGKEMLLHTPIYDVEKRLEHSATGIKGEYVVINAVEWVSIVAVYRDNFVLVRQYRHGYENITAEFPGGMCDEGEDPIEGAVRELEEETGFKAGKVTLLGKCNPNPALFSNEITFILAEDLTQTNIQHLDSDEVLDFTLAPIDEVINSFCQGEYVNAFMGTALALYMREKMLKKD